MSDFRKIIHALIKELKKQDTRFILFISELPSIISLCHFLSGTPTYFFVLYLSLSCSVKAQDTILERSRDGNWIPLTKSRWLYPSLPVLADMGLRKKQLRTCRAAVIPSFVLGILTDTGRCSPGRITSRFQGHV